MKETPKVCKWLAPSTARKQVAPSIERTAECGRCHARGWLLRAVETAQRVSLGSVREVIFWQGIARAQTPLSFGHDPVSGELSDGSRGRLLALPFAPQILRKLGCNILCLLATNPRNIRYHTLR